MKMILVLIGIIFFFSIIMTAVFSTVAPFSSWTGLNYDISYWIVSGIFIVVVAIPTFLFERKLKKERNK